MQTQGKQNKKVTTLLLKEMVAAIDALLEMRDDCGILEENNYLFANSSLGHLSSWDTLTSLAKDAGCLNPMSITSTRLRKYLATIFQVRLSSLYILNIFVTGYIYINGTNLLQF